MIVEHVIVDGGSSDGTLEYLKSLGPTATEIHFISEPDKGIYDAMNKGVRLATGEVLNFLNADDRYEGNDAIARSVQPFLTGSPDYVFGRARICTKEDEIVGMQTPSFWMPYFLHPYCHQTLFVRKDVFVRLGGYELRFGISADTQLLWKLFEARCPFCEIDAPTIRFQEGGVSGREFYRVIDGLSRVACRFAPGIREWLASGKREADRGLLAHLMYGVSFPSSEPEQQRRRIARRKLVLLRRIKPLYSGWRRATFGLLEALLLLPAARGKSRGPHSMVALLIRGLRTALRLRYRLVYRESGLMGMPGDGTESPYCSAAYASRSWNRGEAPAR